MIGQNQIRKLNPNGGEGGLIVPALFSDGKTLTIIGWGSWMFLECGGMNQPAPSRLPQNTVKNKTKKLDFLKVHNQ